MAMKTTHQTAFITGASSGIGRAFACRFAQMGYDLVITGRRKPELDDIAEILRLAYQIRVEVITGDLGSRMHRRLLCRKIAACRNLKVLINNAGFGMQQEFFQAGSDTVRLMVETHVAATVELTRAALPGMIERHAGTIINVSSLGAFIPGFTKSLYLGTKSFIHYFTEALGTEVAPFGIKVQSLCPGMTTTDFHRHLESTPEKKRFRLLPFMEPEKVVSTSLRALSHGIITCIPGIFNRMLFILSRIIPTPCLAQLSHLSSSGIPFKPHH
jgi:short-subunit dehydrogenase